MENADNRLTEQEKERLEDFARLPAEVQRHLLTYGAGMMASAKLVEAQSA